MRDTGSGTSRIWLLALVLLVGALVQACTDQKGGGGTFPTGQTGHADTSFDIVVQVATNPNAVEVGRRIGLTVLVTNFNGRPLEGRHVQLSTSSNQLDHVDGFTDADGKFITFLFCDTNGSPTITAFVEGALGTGKGICGSGSASTTVP